MLGYPGFSRAFAINKLLIAVACDTRMTLVSGRRAKRAQAATCMRASARAHRRWLPSWGLGALALGTSIVTPGTGPMTTAYYR
jgi:hypothetical protein